MSEERSLSLQKIDQGRGDLYAIADELEFNQVPAAAAADAGLFRPHAAVGDGERLGFARRARPMAGAVSGKPPEATRSAWAKLLLFLSFVAACGLIGAIGLYLQAFGWLG